MFFKMEEEWNICPEHWIKNFKCILNDRGKWRLEDGLVYGKWLFVMDKISDKNCPSFADQRNFITGLLEAEKRNDKFRLRNNSKPQKEETIRKFRECLDEVERSWGDKEEQKIL